jgi:pimeloyl-ACP methyl ester carboxylesterase
VAVFVHGLSETEDAWVRPPLSGRRAPRASYGALLREDLAYTAVYVRYNGGRHISDNGRALSELLEALVASWPVDVQALALVGHSMGGLVARSASRLGEFDGCGWVVPLRHVVCLDTPHRGAPLEKAANVAGWTLGRLPETRPFAKVVNGRSAGIKDLHEASDQSTSTMRASREPTQRYSVTRLTPSSAARLVMSMRCAARNLRRASLSASASAIQMSPRASSFA